MEEGMIVIRIVCPPFSGRELIIPRIWVVGCRFGGTKSGATGAEEMDGGLSEGVAIVGLASGAEAVSCFKNQYCPFVM